MPGNAEPKAVYGFAGSAEAGQRLARELGLPYFMVELHHFPDGESLVRIPQFAETAILYRSLDRPNDKLIEIILAAAALRSGGNRHLTLVAPYLAYMRQDIAFRPGEAVSQQIIGTLLAGYFNRFIAVNPHLHRTSSLSSVFPGSIATALNAASEIGLYLKETGLAAKAIAVGPDVESAALITPLAAVAGMPGMVARKIRRGDRDVTIELPPEPDIKWKPTIIVDDVISSGATILDCAARLYERGAASVSVCTVHALFGTDVAERFRAAGIGEVMSCDSIAHPSNRIVLAPLIAREIETKEIDK